MNKIRSKTPESSQLSEARTYSETENPVAERGDNAREFSYRANCFPVRHKKEPWHADFMGDMTLDGVKWVVFVYFRKGRYGAPYILVSLSRREQEAA
jgi:hypothetical protein